MSSDCNPIPELLIRRSDMRPGLTPGSVRGFVNHDVSECTDHVTLHHEMLTECSDLNRVQLFVRFM